MMNFKCFSLGDIATNCYLAWCAKDKEAVVIDPGFEAREIPQEIEALGLKVRYIINTHGHFDHIGGNSQLHSLLGAPIAVSSEDAGMLSDPHANLSHMVGLNVLSPPPLLLLQDGDILSFGACSLKVLSTPGHTPGGISLYGHGLLFSGDTLFKESIGRASFPGGNYRQLLKSIQSKLMTLPAETKVLPGHGPLSTLAWEKAHNDWIREG